MIDIKFNVFGVDDKESIYPLYISKTNCDETCNLILIENHYVWIKDLNKLMNTQSKAKKASNDQELIQSDATSCPQNRKGNN